MNQKCKIRIYIINIYGQCFLCTTSMLRFLFVFPAVITVGDRDFYPKISCDFVYPVPE